VRLDPFKTFFTSDTHFGHRNIIKYCNRPFKDENEMDAVIITNWNNKVKPDDTVFHLGDVSLSYNIDVCKEILGMLNGKIHLIVGNHERNALDPRIKGFWKSVSTIKEISVTDADGKNNSQDIVLCHYPMRAWNKAFHGSWQLFGHVHGVMDGNLLKNQLDVGVDSCNYTPLSYWEVKERILNGDKPNNERHAIFDGLEAISN
jgi:calcineurin-like phosphoesterase family protein